MRDLIIVSIFFIGSFVEEYCRSYYIRGKCTSCDRGIFTVYVNGLDFCNVCVICFESEFAVIGIFFDFEIFDLVVIRFGTFFKEVINVEFKYFFIMMFVV